MHYKTRPVSGLRLNIITLVVLLLFLSTGARAMIPEENNTVIALGAGATPQATTPQVIALVTKEAVGLYYAPLLALERTETENLTSTVYGAVMPGSENTTITALIWDWGDNGTPEYHNFPYSHTYQGPGMYTLSVTAFQSDGQETTRTAVINVSRPAMPDIQTGLPDNTFPGLLGGPAMPAGAPQLTLLEPVIDGKNVTLNGNLNPGSPGATISSVSVDWDDGNITNYSDLPASYRYAMPGIFTINITGIQSDGQSTSKRITLDLRSGNPLLPAPGMGAPPEDNLPLYFIILLTALVVVALGAVAQRFMFRRGGGPDLPDIPKAVAIQEEIYYQAKERGDLPTAAASAHICARLLRSLALESPKKRETIIEMAEKWEEIARNAERPVVPEHPHPKAMPTLEKLPTGEELAGICSGTDVTPDVLESVIRVAVEIAREGREGQAVGTSFVVGDTPHVLENSRQFVLNPFQGHQEADRQITDTGLRGNIKEFAQLDGAFIITGKGIVEAAGRYITVDMSQVSIPGGLGSRHSSIAGITMVTRSVGIVVSQSGGLITVFKDGKIIHTTSS